MKIRILKIENFRNKEIFEEEGEICPKNYKKP